MRIYFCIAFILPAFSVTAQNLVVNPGFEEMKKRQTQYGYFTRNITNGWARPSDGTSDYFYFRPGSKHAYYNSPLITPYEGNACAGFIATPICHEYLKGTLSASLTAGKTYTITIAIATNDSMPFDPRKFGFYFSENKNVYYNKTGMKCLPYAPQVTIADASDSLRSGKWMVYSIPYTATGGEKCFIIGDFVPPKRTRHTTSHAYYFYVDNICIGDCGLLPVQDTLVSPPADLPVATLPAKDTLIAPGKTLVANNIYFETGKSALLAASYPPLYHILSALTEQPELNVEISGHTDDVGKPAANQELSEARAKAVADFFIANGIDPSRITCKGYGSTQPVGEDRDKNRRVEFKFSD